MTASNKFLTVGSLLRDPELLTYREKIEQRDDITYPFYDDFDGYKEVEDKAVSDSVKKQVEVGLPEVSDGEQARALWHLDFAWGLEGIGRHIADQGYLFKEEESGDEDYYETRKDIALSIDGPLSGKDHPFVAHWKRVADQVEGDVKTKQTIPALGQIYIELLSSGEIDRQDTYDGDQEVREDLVQAYKDFVKDYADAGGQILQMDDCIWSYFTDEVNPDRDSFFDKSPEGSKEGLAYAVVGLNNQVIDYAHDLGLKVYTHNCRGNYASRGAMTGTYSEVAKFFLEKQNYDRFYLEWDDERAGSLEVLSVFKDRPEVEVVLGSLSSKLNTLDDAERTTQMLEEASQYIAKENLYLSHQCGFASCDVGNELSEEEQWEKIKQGQKIAYQFFGE